MKLILYVLSLLVLIIIALLMMGHTVVHFSPFYITMKTPYIPVSVIVIFLIYCLIQKKVKTINRILNIQYPIFLFNVF